MQLLVNELSLDGQFQSPDSFLESLKALMACRDVSKCLGYEVYCSRSIIHRSVTRMLFFKQVVHTGDLARKVRIWLDRDGPFWDEPPEHNPDEWYECQGQVVTETSLGEVCYKVSRNVEAALISFDPSDFLLNPLLVVWRQCDEQTDTIGIDNFWNHEDVRSFLERYRPFPTSWTLLLEQAKADFSHLTFLDSVLDAVASEPFSMIIAQRTLHLLDVLNRLKGSFDSDGALTPAGHELLQNFFHGEKAAFSDESDSNKRKFRQDLTFRTPDGGEIFCPFHGKISSRYYRIHHSWPIQHDEPLSIAYIGPKITKE